HTQASCDCIYQRLERFENIEQQFVAMTQEKRRYRRVLIIDDVITTGSSIHALSQALKQLGCTSIYASCLAAASSTSY
ncbi:phosphoribosyltransferase, partial [Acinetobacter nosocomialis]|nr:phosphoribosyltransferase [Acinetobacter nosocomialis]